MYDRDVPDDSRARLEFTAGGLVLDEQSRVLLIRARDLRGQPVWTLPKGALAPGETSAEAALREVREETGYRCELERDLGPVTYWFRRDGRQIKKTVRWFLMRARRPCRSRALRRLRGRGRRPSRAVASGTSGPSS